MANEPRVLNTGNEGNTETTYVSGGTESANVGNEPRVLGSQPSNSNGTIAGGNGVASATVSTEAREAVQTNDVTETEAGESGVASSHVTTEAREAAVSEQENENVNMTNVRAVATGNTNERSLTVAQDYRAGHYERNAESGRGFERSKGEKNVVNTITVDEVKMLIKKYGGNADVYTREQIDEMLATIREGQYVKVDTTEYPTLEDFLASEGEQGTVYLYPVGNEENNYYQYIWEVSEWVSLGSTRVDMSGYPTLDGNNTFTGENVYTVDIAFDNSETEHRWKIYQNVSGHLQFDRGSTNILSLAAATLFPNVDNQLLIGMSNKKIKTIYLYELDFSDNVYSRKITYSGNTTTFFFQNKVQIRADEFSPFNNNATSLGNSTKYYKEAYITKIIGDNVFNVIDASDIVSNTLTQAQYDLITNGKPTLIKGTIALGGYTYKNAIVFYWLEYSTTWSGILISGATITSVVLNTNTKELSIGGNDIVARIASLYTPQINGISINQFYKKPQASVTVTDGGTITDNTLKTLIQNEQPIKLNGYTGYFSCDDGTNYQYHSIIFDSVNNVNHLNVITINKSTWVVTFHTSNFALN